MSLCAVIPPSRFMPVRSGSLMWPVLGEVKPESRHLNLKWSVTDTDRVLQMAQSDAMTDLQIAKRMGSDVRREEIVRICSDAGVFLRLDPR